MSIEQFINLSSFDTFKGTISSWGREADNCTIGCPAASLSPTYQMAGVPVTVTTEMSLNIPKVP